MDNHRSTAPKMRAGRKKSEGIVLKLQVQCKALYYFSLIAYGHQERELSLTPANPFASLR
jgi:hypothetical protein